MPSASMISISVVRLPLKIFKVPIAAPLILPFWSLRLRHCAAISTSAWLAFWRVWVNSIMAIGDFFNNRLLTILHLFLFGAKDVGAAKARRARHGNFIFELPLLGKEVQQCPTLLRPRRAVQQLLIGWTTPLSRSHPYAG